ncbi:hsp70 family protein [Gigaspora margarita]|uniref:Hsp70 family protein n=1 Tax=Gigaspora margarita TaxID=4874 RepID=A0A8H4EVL2_GIGMA|nr:hsp70 family protein [Gigaspora margarita]
MIRNFAKNTLSSVNKISIQIDNKVPVTYDKLNPESTLKEVREKLSNSEEQTRIYEYMNFVGPYGIILRDQENNELLRENLHDGYILKIERSIDPNINEITHRCKLNYGIRMTEDGPKNLNEMAFEFPQDITQSVKMRKFYAEYKYEGMCTSKHENFLRKNLVTEEEISIAMPSGLYIGFIISGGNQTDDTYNTEFSSKYKIRLFSRYKIEIDIEKVQPTEIFIQGVNSALESDNTIDELKRVCEKFGEYIARNVKTGGRMHKIEYYNMSNFTPTNRSANINIGSKLVGSIGGSYNNVNEHNVSSSMSDDETYIRFYGGDENKFKEDNLALWQDSLDDYTTWQVIEYTDLIPIFDVLNSELRQKVLDTMGQKVLYSKPEKFYNTDMSLSKQTDYGTGARLWWKAVCPEIHQKILQNEESELNFGSLALTSESEEELSEQEQLYSVEKSHSAKPSRYKSDDDFKFYIENLLSGNRILVNSFNNRKDKIDIIATFNRQIILIHASNSSDVDTLKGLQTSVARYGEGILSVIVQNSEIFNNSSIKNERSYRKIKIVTEKMIVNYIKNRLKNNYKKTLNIKYGLSANTIGRRENDVWSGSKRKIGDSVSWICSECTYINNPIMPDCEMCSTARTAKNNFIEEINTINQLENQDYISTERPAKDKFIEAINEIENQDYISTARPAKYNFLEAINQLEKHDNFFFEPMAEISKNKNLCLEQQWDCPECTLINESDVVMCIVCGYVKDNSIK